MTQLYKALKADPYNTIVQAQTYIKPSAFYDTVYMLPTQSEEKAALYLEQQYDSPASILRLNGYAGCGKTLFVHYLARKYGSCGAEELFWYTFDQGEGRDYTLEHVITRIIDRLSREIDTLVTNKSPSLHSFLQIGKEFFCEETINPCVIAFFSDNTISSRLEKGTADITHARTIEEIRKDIKCAYEGKDLTDAQVLTFLLILDYLLRCALSYGKATAGRRKYIFCLLDNLDNLRRDAVADLFCSMVRTVEIIRDYYQEAQYLNSTLDFSPFIYLFPTRAVTNRKLVDELRRKGEYEIIDRPGIMDCIELSLDSTSHGTIIEKRFHYWQNHKQLTGRQADEISQAKELIETRFAQGTFSSLFNNNYSRCVDRILEFGKTGSQYSKYAKECVHPIISIERTSPAQLKSAVLTAQRGTFLRILLEVLKSGDAYASPTDVSSPNMFRINSKLGLVDLLGFHDSNQAYHVSLSRLVLSYLKSKSTKTANLYELFDCYDNYEPAEICRCVYALSENIRDKWRRLIMFNRNIPIGIEDLYKQATAYQNNKQIDYLEIELCVAGEEYLNVVVPSFEFFLSRQDNERDNTVKFPPLFSSSSILSGKWKNSIQTVFESVERCAEQLFQFDRLMIEKLLKCDKDDIIPYLFVVSKNDPNAKQTHLSRLVFSQIAYIESFRRYYLWYSKNTISPENRKSATDLIDDNQWIISYIIRYLTLFDMKWIDNRPQYKELLNNHYLPKDFKTSIKTDCYSVNNLLRDTGKKYRFDNIHEGFRKQSLAQTGLLNKVHEIHNRQYSEETFIVPIELDRD